MQIVIALLMCALLHFIIRDAVYKAVLRALHEYDDEKEKKKNKDQGSADNGPPS